MAKSRTHYICRDCGGVQSRWMGKCPECGAWDALERFVEPKETGDIAHGSIAASWVAKSADEMVSTQTQTATPLPRIETADVHRFGCGIGEFDRVLGGGLVPGSVVLLGGDPGIGKSTLLLQAAGKLARAGRTVLYVTSEESAYQTRLRAERLFDDSDSESGSVSAAGSVPAIADLDRLLVLADTNLLRIVEQARKVRPDVMVIDSIQMVYSSSVEASPGSVSQLRRCCTELVYLAKVSGMAVALVGHVTKDGQLAGPKLLEHLVDVVLSFEGDHHHAHRVVRAVKNRYGTTLEVGLFEMTGGGLAEVSDAGVLLDPSAAPQPGSVICPAIHGTRCLLVEVQALTAAGFLGSAKRRTTGVDSNRLAMLIAVLEKHGGLRLADQDVFASAVGGLKVVEPAADLGLCLAIAGAYTGKAMPAGTAVVGEVGLGGEVRQVHQLQQRWAEAARLGYHTFLTPPQDVPAAPLRKDGHALLKVDTVAEALEILGPAGKAG